MEAVYFYHTTLPHVLEDDRFHVNRCWCNVGWLILNIVLFVIISGQSQSDSR